jgi:hypothetical protein
MTDHNGSNEEGPNKRRSWTRTLDIVLRSMHVLVISALFGGAVFRIPTGQLLLCRALAAVSGAALIASEVSHRRGWPRQGRGLMVYIHAGLFSLACAWPKLAPACLAAALVIGMTGSHMPKKLRYWEFTHGGGRDKRERENSDDQGHDPEFTQGGRHIKE